MRWSIGSMSHLLIFIDGQALSIVQSFYASRFLYIDRLSVGFKQSDDPFDRVSQVLNFRTTDSRMRTVLTKPFVVVNPDLLLSTSKSNTFHTKYRPSLHTCLLSRVCATNSIPGCFLHALMKATVFLMIHARHSEITIETYSTIYSISPLVDCWFHE